MAHFFFFVASCFGIFVVMPGTVQQLFSGCFRRVALRAPPQQVEMMVDFKPDLSCFGGRSEGVLKNVSSPACLA